jgi:L-asparagine oxygenase
MDRYANALYAYVCSTTKRLSSAMCSISFSRSTTASTISTSWSQSRGCAYRLVLQSEDIEKIERIIKKIDDISPLDTPDLFCKKCKEVCSDVPVRVKNYLLNFAKYGSETGYLLIQGIQIDEVTLPKTPNNNNFGVGGNTVLAKIQALFINIIGEMISYEAEGYGRIFQDVVPIKKMEKDQTSLGSNTELEIHTEQAFSELRPDILCLSCLRGDPDAFTYILPVEKIINTLTTQEIQTLYKPLWKTGVDMSFKLNNHDFINGDTRGPLSILSGSQNDPILIFDQDLMKGLDNISQNMIKKIVDIYYSNRLQHNLLPGEIIFIDNRRAVHGRSPFFPKYDGNDRFLVRCFGTFHYEKSEYARKNGGRMVSAIYS